MNNMDNQLKQFIVTDFDLDSLTDEEKEEIWIKARKLILQKTLQDIIASEKQPYLKLGRKIIEEMESESQTLELENDWMTKVQYIPSGHFGKFKSVAVYVDKDNPYGISVEEDENDAYCHQLFKMISRGLIEMEDGKIKMEGNIFGGTKVGFVSLKDDEGE